MELFTDSKKDQQPQNGPQGQNPQGTEKNHAQGQSNKAGEQTNNISEMGAEVKTLTTRLRSLEEKYRNLRTSLQIVEKNTLEDNKKKNAEMKDFNQEMFELKQSFKEVKDKMDIIIKELALTSKKEEVETIQRYLNLWNPVNFVNQHEIKPIVRRALLELGIRSKNDVENVEDITPEMADSNTKQEQKSPFDI